MCGSVIDRAGLQVRFGRERIEVRDGAGCGLGRVRLVTCTGNPPMHAGGPWPLSPHVEGGRFTPKNDLLKFMGTENKVVARREGG